jgi:hypothetical protein
MIKYIIDGNNLIGKLHFLSSLQKKDKQVPREKLAFMIEDYFYDKNIKVSLHFDGYENLPIKMSKTKIHYSESKIADIKIKNEIELAKNRKNLFVVTSDNNIKEFAKVCGCKVMSSEEFAEQLTRKGNDDEEKRLIDSMNDNELFKKLFNAKKL